MTKKFILYDGRAKFGDTDLADAMDVEETEEAARLVGRKIWSDVDAVWFEYDFDAEKNVTTNEKMRPDLPPFGKTK